MFFIAFCYFNKDAVTQLLKLLLIYFTKRKENPIYLCTLRTY